MRHIATSAGAHRLAREVRRLAVEGSVNRAQAVILGLHLATPVALDIASGLDPGATVLRQTGRYVDGLIGIGIGTGSIVNGDTFTITERDFAHRHPQLRVAITGDINLFGAGQRFAGNNGLADGD